MASIFEKTMAACLESKKAPASKRVTEKKSSMSKTLKKKITESTLREEDEMEVDVDTDPVDDELTMGDVEDDIVVVVDPSIDEDEFTQAAADAQDIVDNTPDGDIPMTDEYIGDYTYTCPICGNTFFSDVEMGDGDECPVCGDFPNGYVLVGQIDGTEEGMSDDMGDEEDLDLDTDDVDDVDDTEELDIDLDSAEECGPRCAGKSKNAEYEYDLDESTFNPFLTKFVRENYRNAKSLRVSKVALEGNSTLRIESILTFKSGKTKPVVLKIERFKPARRMTLAAKESSNTFKIESRSSKVAPFVFEAVIVGKTIKCKGLKYNLITRTNEGKKAQVYGKLVESVKRNKSKRSSDYLK